MALEEDSLKQGLRHVGICQMGDCTGLPLSDYPYNYLAQCNCDDLGYYKEITVLDPLPPPPPSPPEPPQAPPIVIVNGSEVVIDVPDYADDHLEEVVETEPVRLVTLYADVTLSHRLPLLNHSLTIHGRCNFTDGSTGTKRCTIDGTAAGTILQVAPGVTLSMDRVVLTNNHLPPDSEITDIIFGGAISVLGDIYNPVDKASVELYDCVLANNRATGDGGAVYVEDGLLLLVDCHFTSNEAEGFGGAVAAFSADVVLHNCTVEGGSARQGGGLYVGSSNLTVTAGSLVAGNLAVRHGGGLCCEDSAVLIEGGSRVAENHAEYNQYSSESSGLGGGVYFVSALSAPRAQRRALLARAPRVRRPWHGLVWCWATPPSLATWQARDGSGPLAEAPIMTCGVGAGKKGGGIFLMYGALDMTLLWSHANQAVSGGGIYGYYASSIAITGGSLVADNVAGTTLPRANRRITCLSSWPDDSPPANNRLAVGGLIAVPRKRRRAADAGHHARVTRMGRRPS
ncbi:hypothetical protein CYMTET_34490 [Cymbomonas tetramitiformis]|uniref:Right handed beta helix domain-containing protein n=1 Tax=Cymbomonas tetramitiformis TaxID=36881 RepID=A0AAE0FB20_9CHLO|nr:hypothetical protein CYMTET_34490 [Cymbomonas tetramitiformis]